MSETLSVHRHLVKFVVAVERAEPGDQIEIGVIWRAWHGWFPYMRIGDWMLPISSRTAAGRLADLVTAFLAAKQKATPDDVTLAALIRDLAGCFRNLLLAADECDRRNVAGMKPTDPGAMMPPGQTMQ